MPTRLTVSLSENRPPPSLTSCAKASEDQEASADRAELGGQADPQALSSPLEKSLENPYTALLTRVLNPSVPPRT